MSKHLRNETFKGIAHGFLTGYGLHFLPFPIKLQKMAKQSAQLYTDMLEESGIQIEKLVWIKGAARQFGEAIGYLAIQPGTDILCLAKSIPKQKYEIVSGYDYALDPTYVYSYPEFEDEEDRIFVEDNSSLLNYGVEIQSIPWGQIDEDYIELFVRNDEKDYRHYLAYDLMFCYGPMLTEDPPPWQDDILEEAVDDYRRALIKGAA